MAIAPASPNVDNTPGDAFGRLQSTVTVLSPILKNDFNRDGHVNAADVQTMLMALTDVNLYKSSYGAMTDSDVLSIGDANSDGKFTNGDLQSLLNILNLSPAVHHRPACQSRHRLY